MPPCVRTLRNCFPYHNPWYPSWPDRPVGKSESGSSVSHDRRSARSCRFRSDVRHKRRGAIALRLPGDGLQPPWPLFIIRLCSCDP